MLGDREHANMDGSGSSVSGSNVGPASTPEPA
jgi:hypothetical protein